MKLRYTIAQGYAAQMETYKSEHSDVNNAALAFAREKYGAWIERALETTDYEIIDANPSEFIVEFGSEAKAKQFQRDLGGKVVE